MRATILAAVLVAASTTSAIAYCPSWDTNCLNQQQPSSAYNDAYQQPMFQPPPRNDDQPIDLFRARNKWNDQQPDDNPYASPLGLHSDTQNCRIMLCTD